MIDSKNRRFYLKSLTDAKKDVKGDCDKNLQSSSKLVTVKFAHEVYTSMKPNFKIYIIYSKFFCQENTYLS